MRTDPTAATRAHVFHRARVEATADPRRRVGAVASYLQSVMAALPAEQAAALAQRFTDETLELIEMAEHEAGKGTALWT